MLKWYDDAYIHVYNMPIINVLGSVTYNNPWTNYHTVDKNKGLMRLPFASFEFICINV